MPIRLTAGRVVPAICIGTAVFVVAARQTGRHRIETVPGVTGRQSMTRRAQDGPSIVASMNSDDLAEKVTPNRDGDDLRFLLAILTGVALGAGAAVLPGLLGKSQGIIELVTRVLLWFASLAVVLLIYLSAADASRMYRGRQDVGQTAVFLIITMLEASLFSATMFDVSMLTRWWFLLFGAFGFVAAAQVAFVHRRVRREPALNLRAKAQSLYLRSLRLDAIMAVVGASVALIFGATTFGDSQLTGLIGALVVLVYMTAANLSQRRVRRVRPA